MKKNKKLCIKKTLLILFALLMIPGISFAEDFVINFESDALGKTYPCVAGNKNDISAVVEKNGWNGGQCLHIVTTNRDACPKFTVTLPEGKTLADVKKIRFDLFLVTDGEREPNQYYFDKSFYCMFGEKGSSSLVSSNLDTYTTSQFISIPISMWVGKEFIPTIPENLLSLNQFDWAFGLDAVAGDYYLDNIVFSFVGEFEIQFRGVHPPSSYLEYQGHSLRYVPQTYVKEGVIINPYRVAIRLDEVPKPMDITYSLYTYKPTFRQEDGRRYDPPYVTSPSIGALNYGPGMIFSTQKDIDDNLDLIYTFAPIKETETVEWKTIVWDGKTLDGRAVRDCVLLAAHDSKGKLLSVDYFNAVQGYEIGSYPGVEYTAHNTKEDGKYVSAKITLAYEKPVRRIWAIVGTAACTMGSKRMSFKVVNGGAEAIAATMNSEAIKPALAVTELKNPTLDEGGLVKIYKWDNIRKINWNEPKWKNYITTYNTGTWQPAPELDGTSLLPPDEETDYEMIIVIEGDDGNGNVIPTFTGLNDGYVFEGWPVHFPMPQLETDIPVIPVVSPVYNMEGGIGIHASNEKVSIYGIDGRLVKQVVAEPFIPLPQGLYIVKVGTAEAVKVVVK